MKTLEQFKEAYANILDTESKDSSELVNLTIEAGKLRLLIQCLEMGVTEESLIRQLYKLKQQNKTPDIKNRIKYITWALEY